MFKPATEKQVNYIRSLAKERGVEDEANVLLDNNPSRKAASDYIGDLLRMRKVHVTPGPKQEVDGLDLRSIPAGRYAAEDEDGILRFFRIDNVPTGRWAGFVFVHIQASDETYRQGMQKPNQAYSGKSQAALRNILSDPKGAAMRYGTELGVCGVCGRTLTDPDSIAKGIGPICEGRF